ncbi:MAG: TlyA family RNA methyltransferase [Liquorilactobacillus nagelii]|jgi:23S rRNA (cytidine1920-2'-O)/16S rRNA (cytidine1409-2'-O)-methyltransferase|uniref:TlyA family rRNA (Cytidine-2'-O)-methyltransferase n=1 Tax=Liquorilactobacillus nagelii TaxID=82688 RepID=A0A3Q8CZH2_9LACO|nr:TlyA family RNA methyltransferase [Liquorilactobacillus nagelii]AUJ32272.1 TlyA family rRNA (cytidine-2'-O)-methyltransferase [Liquorilactobacillus nagelii]KRL40816.1 hemolysin A [Liquorilactobacillus nagelii DSM 13675]MCC7615447.1 TlyA family rRNA (cytidine-2'-O)-methyltransferase [Liquorilactobacillus nagelii]MCI1699505.1 TlyA family RNA methyltransferase [Liquorilactobacillus nagelii]MCP9314683.1 TlyA family RNA methyltransferase [Liquorilactobacillus nagelii]
MTKQRVDILLVEQGLFSSREQAKRAVMAGEILGANEERLDKPGMKIDVKTKLHFKGSKLPYVSRGGLKLAKALNVFKIDVKNKIVLDIGSSTGGFTDVMLQNGAARSYALDVGTNQLVWKLRQDPRVIVMENTNFRYSQPSDFSIGVPEFASIDVSFISLKLILPNLHQILPIGGEVVALIKPQFEAGREKVGKHGIIREPKVHQEVLEEILHFARTEKYDILGLDFSPITGGSGNIEFLVHLKSSHCLGTLADRIDISKVLHAAWQQLK